MKRFNFTGRKRILREDIKIRLHGTFHDKPKVDVAISFKGYQFPAGSSVVLEPHASKTRSMRVPMGVVSDDVRQNSVSLDKFDDADGLSFRVKVVDEDEGLLLGIAENIKPYDKNGKPHDNNRSILPVASLDLSSYGVLWRLDYDDQQATLQVERNLGSREQVVRSLLFRGFILPAAMREILIKITAEDWDEDLQDPLDLSTRWLMFTRQIGAGLPVRGDDNSDWIDSAIRILTKEIGVRQQIIHEFESGAWK